MLLHESRKAAGESGFAGCLVPVDRHQRTASQRGLTATGRNLTRYLEKIPQPGELKDLLSRQNGGDHFTLRSGVNFIQTQLGHRLQRELPYAFVESALSNEVGHGATDRFAV